MTPPWQCGSSRGPHRSLACRTFVRLEVGSVGSGWQFPLMLLCLAFFLDPIQSNLLNGQVNSEVLLLSVLFLDSILEGTEERARPALGDRHRASSSCPRCCSCFSPSGARCG